MNAVNTAPYKLPRDAVWLVTGCSSGIGRSIAKHIASQPGQRLIATARDVSTLSYLLAETENNSHSDNHSDNHSDKNKNGDGDENNLPPTTPSRILLLPLDVTSPSSVDAAFKAAASHFGESPGADAEDNNFHIDVLVNNAGYALSGDTEGATEEETHEIFETNFFGTVRVTMGALEWMRPRLRRGEGEGEGEKGEDKGEDKGEEKHRGGLIFNMSSLAGVCAFPGHAFYHASKFAVEGWTESVAREMHPNWNVNFCIIEPGAVKTNFENHSKKHITPHPAYTHASMPARKLELLVQQGLKAGYGVIEPDQVAKMLFHVASRNEKVPLRLPLGATAAKLIETGLRARLGELEDGRMLSEFRVGG